MFAQQSATHQDVYPGCLSNMTAKNWIPSTEDSIRWTARWGAPRRALPPQGGPRRGRPNWCKIKQKR